MLNEDKSQLVCAELPVPLCVSGYVLLHMNIHPLQTRLVLTALFKRPAACVVPESQLTATEAVRILDDTLANWKSSNSKCRLP